MKVIDFLMIFVLICSLVYLYNYLKVEGFIGSPETSLKFMTASETNTFLMNDGDLYVANLSPTDLFARKVTSHEDYIRKISQSGTNLSQEQKSRFTEACREADLFFNKLNIPGITSKKIVEIPWVISMTRDNQYEDGLPHTRANIIFVSSNINENKKSLIKTLIHEKVHIYQRLHSEEVSQYLESKGYLKWKQRLGVPRIRANPDLDPFIYVDPSTKKEMAAYYTSDKPYNISDIILNDVAFEHPYELMAYTIESRFDN